MQGEDSKGNSVTFEGVIQAVKRNFSAFSLKRDNRSYLPATTSWGCGAEVLLGVRHAADFRNIC